MPDTIYLGVGGHLVALDRDTGRELWRQKVPGSGHVTNIVVDGDRIYVSTAGMITCIHAATRRQLWQNTLPGLGFGFVAISTASSGAGTPAAAPAEIAHQQARRAAD